MSWQLHWVESKLGSLEDSQTTDRELQDAYEWTVHRYRQSAEALNERIAVLNLTIPLVSLQRQKVRIDEELGRFSESWLSKVETHRRRRGGSASP